jgi:hypothetical protein
MLGGSWRVWKVTHKQNWGTWVSRGLTVMLSTKFPENLCKGRFPGPSSRASVSVALHGTKETAWFLGSRLRHTAPCLLDPSERFFLVLRCPDYLIRPRISIKQWQNSTFMLSPYSKGTWKQTGSKVIRFAFPGELAAGHPQKLEALQQEQGDLWPRWASSSEKKLSCTVPAAVPPSLRSPNHLHLERL